MAALRIATVSLLAVAMVAGLNVPKPSDPVRLCGSSLTNLVSHPACDTQRCHINWPRPGQMRDLVMVMCTGQQTMEDVMELCCLPDMEAVAGLLEAAVAHDADAPLPPHKPATRHYAPRVPNIRRPIPQQDFASMDSAFTGF